MSDLTLKRVDAAIRRTGLPFTSPSMTREYRAIFLSGMSAAAAFAWQAGIDNPKHPTGHARDAIRAAIRRLEGEMRNA